MAEPFEVLEHTADVGFLARGASTAEVFANSARALMSIAAGRANIAPAGSREVVVRGHDYESLLVNWLSEILYLFDTGQFAAGDFEVLEIAADSLRARLHGEPRRPADHPWKLIVKAITYHQIEVAERNGRWEARVFVDV
jgi:SHS2 domain-containing protein